LITCSRCGGNTREIVGRNLAEGFNLRRREFIVKTRILTKDY
jgi:hypothetical protein